VEDVNRAFVDGSAGPVVEFKILERSASGRIRRLGVVREALDPALAPPPNTTILQGDGQIRSMFSKRMGSTTALPSSTFVLSPRADAQGQLLGWDIQGAGWGHGVGMCQRGAQNHALEGWDARRIVNWYYRDVEIRTVTPQTVAAWSAKSAKRG
jgi:SpoIID/LytB domain protein